MGWALGRYAPERFASIAIGGAHRSPSDDAVWKRIDRMRSYLAEGMEYYVTWRESQTGPWPPTFRARVLGNDARALAAYTSVSPDQRGHAQSNGLSRMTMPVLVISGDDDELYAGFHARQAAASLPDATFIEIPNADHFTLYRRFDLILPHLKSFLTRVINVQRKTLALR